MGIINNFFEKYYYIPQSCKIKDKNNEMRKKIYELSSQIEQKQYKLESENEYLRGLLEATVMPLIHVDTSYNIVFANNTSKLIFNIDDQQISNNYNIKNIIHSEDAYKIDDLVSNYSKVEEVRMLTQPDNIYMYFEMHAYKFYNSKFMLSGYSCSFKDIQQKKINDASLYIILSSLLSKSNCLSKY